MGRCSIAMVVVCVVAICGVAAAEGYVGKVNAGQVNVRAGASTNYKILKTVKEGDLVRVKEKVGDWLKISPPEGCKGWVHSKYLSGNVVTGDSVNIRSSDNVTRAAFGQLKKGETVQIVRTLGQWTQIMAPESADAYIFGKYVDYYDETGKFVAKETAKTEIEKELEQIDKDEEAELKKEDGRDFDPIIERLDELEKKAAAQDDKLALERIKAKKEALTERQKEIVEAVEAAKEKEKKVDGEADSKIAEVPVIPETFDAMGKVEDVGPRFFKPGTHRLRMAGAPLYYLKSDKHDLYQYLGKTVGILGEVVMNRGAKVLIVDSITELHEEEKGDF